MDTIWLACQFNQVRLANLTSQPLHPLTFKPIIVCADDFAISPEVSEGIALLAERSRISATSVMSLSPHWPVASVLLQRLKYKIDVGLHVDFTSEFSVRAGYGEALSRLMLKSSFRALQPTQMALHLNQQLDLFEEHHGAPPKHIDGHQHVHQFPVIREALVKVLSSRYSAAQMPWIRIARIPKSQMSLKSAVINAMGANALQKLAIQHLIPHSSFLTGIYDFVGDATTYAQFLNQCLTQLPSNAVLMCHPGLAGSQDVPYPLARIWEQKVLSSDEFPELLNILGLRLVRGSQSLFRYV